MGEFEIRIPHHINIRSISLHFTNTGVSGKINLQRAKPGEAQTALRVVQGRLSLLFKLVSGSNVALWTPPAEPGDADYVEPTATSGDPLGLLEFSLPIDTGADENNWRAIRVPLKVNPMRLTGAQFYFDNTVWDELEKQMESDEADAEVGATTTAAPAPARVPVPALADGSGADGEAVASASVGRSVDDDASPEGIATAQPASAPATLSAEDADKVGRLVQVLARLVSPADAAAATVAAAGGTGGTGGTAPLQRWEYTLEQTVRWANDALKESPGRRGRQLLTRLAPEVTLDLMRDVAER